MVRPGERRHRSRTTGQRGGQVKAVPIAAEDLPKLLTLADEIRPDLTVVGPDNPLALASWILFLGRGHRIWGPNRQAALFESSKAFAQKFMEKHCIPTARSGIFSDAAAARHFAASLGGKCAVKADGLALGKGVLLCHNLTEASRAINEILVNQAFGVAGRTVVIQELLEGIEVSLHAMCDGKRACLFPTSQDHKRALDGDEGLNTGGMGTYSPTPFLNPQGMAQAQASIIEPWLKGCAAEGIDYRGILYPGVMLTKAGAKVLEFNARFGDPETQVYLTRLKTDFVELLNASANGTLHNLELEWSPAVAVCVVMASGGYPGTYEKGKSISGLDEVATLPDVKVFHAGTARSGDQMVTNGGRVLGVTAWDTSLEKARLKAYAAVERIDFDGAHWREDIGAKALRALA
jgi:phosphoribosylamine--glycine ligase